MDLIKLLESLMGGSLEENKDGKQLNVEIKEKEDRGEFVKDTDKIKYKAGVPGKGICFTMPRLTFYDIYSASWAFDMPVSEIVEKSILFQFSRKTGWVRLTWQPNTSGLPTCSFLEGDTCRLKTNKPFSCKLRPFMIGFVKGEVKLIDHTEAIFGKNYPTLSEEMSFKEFWKSANITEEAHDSHKEYENALKDWKATYSLPMLTPDNYKEIFKIAFSFEDILSVQKNREIKVPPAKLQSLVLQTITKYLEGLTSIKK